MQQRIMIVGADINSCMELKYALQDDAMRVYYATSLDDGIRHFIHYEYQLVILDVSDYDCNVMRSLNFLRKVRLTPLLVLTPERNSTYITEILSVADGFLHKPVDLDICRATIQAFLRRNYYNQQAAPPVLSHDGTLMIDTLRRKVYVMNNEIDLPRKQYELLYLLAINEGQVFTHGQLFDRVWGYDANNSENTLYCQITKLRNSLNAIPGAPSYIKTKRGVGYVFESENTKPLQNHTQ